MIARTGQNRNQGTSASGYTLVEAVLTIVVLSIIGLSTSVVIIESMKVYARTAPALEASYQARLAIEHLQRDIRNLGDPTSITTFTPTAFTFVDASGSTIAYGVSGGDLTRDGDLLARGVSAFAFRYWRKDGAPATVPGDLELVEADLTVQVAGQEQRLFAVVSPRNLSP